MTNEIDGFEKKGRQKRVGLLKVMMGEIHRLSGYKTWQTIADEIAVLRGVGSPISHDMLRQYAAGTKSVSQRKIFSIAMMAKVLNYAGDRCSDVITAASVKDQKWFGLTPAQFEEIVTELDKLKSAQIRSKRRALLGLEKAIVNVSKFGLSDLDLMYAALVMIQKNTPPEERSGGGGIVNPACISGVYGYLATEPVWVETRIVPWSATKISSNGITF